MHTLHESAVCFFTCCVIGLSYVSKTLFIYSQFWGKGTFESPHMYISVTKAVDNSQLLRMYKQSERTLFFRSFALVVRHLEEWKLQICKIIKSQVIPFQN